MGLKLDWLRPQSGRRVWSAALQGELRGAKVGARIESSGPLSLHVRVVIGLGCLAGELGGTWGGSGVLETANVYRFPKHGRMNSELESVKATRSHDPSCLPSSPQDVVGPPVRNSGFPWVSR